MKPDYLHGFLYISPYLLTLFLGISIEIVLSRRLRQKKAEDDSLRENGAQVAGFLVSCRERTRMADITFTYEVQGKIYSKVQHIPEETCNTVHDGDTVFAFYDAQNPERSLLKDITRVYEEALPAAVLFIVMLIYGLTLVIFFIVILIVSLITSF